MKFLIDSHTLIWFLNGNFQLPFAIRELIEDEDNEIFVSIASLWEIAIKISTGKLNLGKPFEILFPSQLEINSMTVLPISIEHLRVVSSLPFHHRDPFDRLIIAQSQVEQMPVVGVDEVFDLYGVEREWS